MQDGYPIQEGSDGHLRPVSPAKEGLLRLRAGPEDIPDDLDIRRDIVSYPETAEERGLSRDLSQGVERRPFEEVLFVDEEREDEMQGVKRRVEELHKEDRPDLKIK